MEELAILGGPPTVDAPLAVASERLTPDLLGVLANGDLSALAGSGPVAELEAQFAQIIGVRYAVALSSGTAALHAALVACGIARGDEVVLSAYDWPAATAVVLHTGARPVFADIDPATYTLDPDSVAERVGPRTKAIIVTHLLGCPADMPRLCDVAGRRGLRVIEDCAQALGARIAGKPVGSFGDAGCFSIGATKIVSAGEGGLLVTDDGAVFDRVLQFCTHPLRQQRAGLDPDPFAMNYRPHPLAALLAVVQLPELEARLAARRTSAQQLAKAMAPIPWLRPVTVPKGSEHSFHRYSPSYDADACEGLPRHLVVTALAAEGVPISLGPVGVPMDTSVRQSRRWRRRVQPFECPIAGQRAQEWECVVALPGAAGPAFWERMERAFEKMHTLRGHLIPPKTSWTSS